MRSVHLALAALLLSFQIDIFVKENEYCIVWYGDVVTCAEIAVAADKIILQAFLDL